MDANWLENYHLFLFDFDGLLVNTEELHFKAYQMMCKERGFLLTWDFPTYCSYAHFEADALKEAIYREFPSLYAQEPNWTVLYAQKKLCYKALLSEGKVALMPGAAGLLQLLAEKGKKCCVVTHSPLEQVEMIRSQLPLLRLIPHWLTREDYQRPKPSPDGYLKALSLYLQQGEKAVGFEDTPRGTQALLAASCDAVLISSFHPPVEGTKYFSSLTELS